MVTRPSVSLAFLSTPSARRATLAHNYESGLNGFLSTPSARRATYLLTVPPTSIKISIHALREEGDDVGVDDVVHIARFLSTPSARRATRASSTATSTCSYFYPRPPRGGRREKSRTKFILEKFLSTPSARRATFLDTPSIPRDPRFLSTPSARRATEVLVQKLAAYEFLSTPSARRATIIGQELFFWCFISIHALREEGDPRKKSVHDKITDFYPRPPRGGRLGGVVVDAARHEFLSTPSARRATNAVQLILESLSISIHALREEGDPHLAKQAAGGVISIHALREEGDR